METSVQELERAFEKLLLESIHYRNTGKGKEFWTKAIESADKTLSDWKQTRPATMGLYECKAEDKR